MSLRSQTLIPRPVSYEICADCEISIEQVRELLHQPLSPINGLCEPDSTANLPQIQDVRLSLLQDEKINGSTKTYPLVVSPRQSSTVAFLSEFLENNCEWVDKQMLNYGAILFRDFDINTEDEVEKSVLLLQPHLNNEYRGTLPRSTQGSTTYIFSAAEVPSNYPIAQHLELSFPPQPAPKQLFFSALKALQVARGETATKTFPRRFATNWPRRSCDTVAHMSVSEQRG
jgi:hypothetical protein